MNEDAEYPLDVAVRFELRTGKFGPYFHDLRSGTDMPLQRVLETLNRYALIKAQLTWYVATYGETEASATPRQIASPQREGDRSASPSDGDQREPK